MNSIVRSPEFVDIVKQWGQHSTTKAVRTFQQSADNSLNSTDPEMVRDYSKKISRWLLDNYSHGYVPVFNLTGTIIHTNLGRASLDSDLLERVMQQISGPVTLEYDLNKGKRGNREQVIYDRLVQLTGAEAASVTNNNAAAITLILNTFAQNKEVIVARGELIEIGGSFRLPELMMQAGCHLVEVGTTNRTWIEDYSNAITPNTGLLMKVHPSNYSVTGFTHAPTSRELGSLSAKKRIPFVLDLGSGALIDYNKLGLPAEPMPSQAIAEGVDLVTFSGDKLLGGPQAGIIVGRKDLCKKLNNNPLKRALRMDKVLLAILNETLKAYETPDELGQHVRLIREMTVSNKQLNHRAQQVINVLKQKLPDYQIELMVSESQIGSGTQPDNLIPTIAVSIRHSRNSKIVELERSLRALKTPIIGRISAGFLILDMRGANNLDDLLATLSELG